MTPTPTRITFADFASRLCVGDTLFVYGSKYKGSELRYNKTRMQETRRFSRVQRIGKTQIQLMDVHGKYHVVESTNTIYLIRQGHHSYKIETPRGAVFVEHQPWKVPATPDEDVSRWVHARWGLVACCATPEGVWDPRRALAPTFYAGAHFLYGRTEKELRYKFDQAQLKVAAVPATVQPAEPLPAYEHVARKIQMAPELGVGFSAPPAADVVPVEVTAVALMLRGAQHQTISIPLPRFTGEVSAWCERVNSLLDGGARLTGYAYTNTPTTKEN